MKCFIIFAILFYICSSTTVSAAFLDDLGQSLNGLMSDLQDMEKGIVDDVRQGNCTCGPTTSVTVDCCNLSNGQLDTTATQCSFRNQSTIMTSFIQCCNARTNNIICR